MVLPLMLSIRPNFTRVKFWAEECSPPTTHRGWIMPAHARKTAPTACNGNPVREAADPPHASGYRVVWTRIEGLRCRCGRGSADGPARPSRAWDSYHFTSHQRKNSESPKELQFPLSANSGPSGTICSVSRQSVIWRHGRSPLSHSDPMVNTRYYCVEYDSTV